MDYKKRIINELTKNKDFSICKQCNNIINHWEEYHGSEKIFMKMVCLELNDNGKRNEELVKKISNTNIEIAQEILSKKIDNIIIHNIYKAYLQNYSYRGDPYYFEHELMNYIFGEDNYKQFCDQYLLESKDNQHKENNIIYDILENTLVYDADFCYNVYYKKYEDILWSNIFDIKNEVFEK